MPGMNQRGPMNQGPMTGRGQGACTGNAMANGAGFGGRGRCGMGRGQGLGRRCFGGNGGYSTPLNREEVLRNRADALKAELDNINQELGGEASDPRD